MKITCPNCSTKFGIGLKTLGPNGRKLKCSACAHIWRETDENVASQSVSKPKEKPRASVAPKPPAPKSVVAPPVPAVEENDQGAIDDMFDAAPTDENDQGAIDDMFDAVPAEENDQGAIDDMFGEAPAEENDQGAIDDMFGEAPAEENDQGAVDDMFDNPLTDALKADPADSPTAKAPNKQETNKEAFEKALPSQSAVYKKQSFSGNKASIFKWGYLATAAVVLLSVFIFGKSFILDYFPKTGAVYSLYGLESNIIGIDFERTAANHQSLDGIDYLYVNGSIINNSGSTKIVPQIRGYLVDAGDNVIYSWAIRKVTKTTLADGEIASFTDVLKNPELSAKRVKFKFVLDKKLADK